MSAAQVRQPMQRRKHAELYDPDIAPLRQLLARAEAEASFS
jgi:hypothetical protein